MNENIFDKLDFGPFRALLDDDDITDISYDNGGQIWVRSLNQGSMRVEIEGATPEFVEKLAFQCSNVMGTTFNNAKPFLDAESAELRMNFVHQSIATNGIALVIRKTPAKIRLEKEKLIKEDYFTPAIHDFLIQCVIGHCNIMVAGETGSGKTEFVKYLASHTRTEEKIITIEDTLELHLDKIYPQRDIVSMKTNNVASYSDVLVTCMRQNPKWILLSEVRSAEAVSAVRNSISSGHNILSTIHADKASAIPYRLYSLMETDLDVNQFLTTIYRYIQLGVHIKAFYSKEYGKFHRELDEVAEFYVDDNNVPRSRIIYQKQMGKMMMCKPSAHLVEYLENQNVEVQHIIKDLPDELPIYKYSDEFSDGNFDNKEEKQENNSSVESEKKVDAQVSAEVSTESNQTPQETSTEVPSETVQVSTEASTEVPSEAVQSTQEPSVESTPSTVITPMVSGVTPVAANVAVEVASEPVAATVAVEVASEPVTSTVVPVPAPTTVTSPLPVANVETTPSVVPIAPQSIMENQVAEVSPQVSNAPVAQSVVTVPQATVAPVAQSQQLVVPVGDVVQNSTVSPPAGMTKLEE